MKFKQKVKMAIEDYVNYVEDEDVSIAVAKVTFLSTKPNSHRHVFTEEVIREYAPTYLGKYIVAEYDEENDDATTHTGDKMNIIGHIPENQEVQYGYDEDGYFNCSVDVSISKLYSKGLYEVIKRDGIKAVSVEELVGFESEDVDKIDGVDEKRVVGFMGIGITVLGKDILPSVPNANITLTKMSAVNYEEEYAKHLKKNSFEGVVLEKLQIIEDELQSRKEKAMGKNTITKYDMDIGDGMYRGIRSALADKYSNDDYCEYWIKGIYQDGEQKYTIVEKWDDEKLYKILFTMDEDGGVVLQGDLIEMEMKFVEINKNSITIYEKEDVKKYEESQKEIDKPIDEVDKKEDDNIDDIKSQLSEIALKYEELKVKYESLAQYKEDEDKKKKEEIVKETMSKSEKYLSKHEYEGFLKDAQDCAYENVGDWQSKVLSKVAIATMEILSSKESDEIHGYGIEKEGKENKHKSLFD